MTRALITGATGFIGRHLAQHLLAASWEVDAIVRPGSDRSPLPPAVNVHEHSGTAESMLSILSLAQPDVVFHLASLFLSEHKPADVGPMIESNVIFGLQLAEAMCRTGATALVNTGTSWQHYEGRDYSPVNLYAATKQAFEDLLQYYVEVYGLRIITLKLYDTYGLDDPRPKLINLLRRIAEDDQRLAMSPGEQMVDFVHVDDVTQAFVVAASRLRADNVVGHERYAVSCGQPIALRELVRMFENACGKTLPINWGGRLYREREVKQPWRGNPLPDWRARIALGAGLAEIVRKDFSVYTDSSAT